jgi:hypothetical protein
MSAHVKAMASKNVSGTQHQVIEIISNTLAASFRNIMLAGQGELMDTLVQRTARLPFIAKIKVYDRFGAVHFGEEENLASEETM